MRNVSEHTGTLTILERLNGSYFGNPRYLVMLDGIVCRTMVDSGEAYGLTNHRDAVVTAEIGIHYGKFAIQNIRGFST